MLERGFLQVIKGCLQDSCFVFFDVLDEGEF